MKKNICYMITGILNLVGAFSNLISSVVMLVLGSEFFSFLVEVDPEMAAEDAEFFEIMNAISSGVYYFMIAIMLVGVVICVISGIKFIKFSAVNEKSSSVVLWIVLTFLFSGLLNGILAIVGYVTNDDETVNVQQTQQVQVKPVEQEKPKPYANVDQLRDLQRLRAENLITEEEYEKMRLRVIEQATGMDNGTLNGSSDDDSDNLNN